MLPGLSSALRSANDLFGSWDPGTSCLLSSAACSRISANRYAAQGAWQTQLEAEPVSTHRPVNLYIPADGESDWGAHGGFDDRAGGFFDPSFLRSLPATMGTFTRAVAATAAEKASSVRVLRNDVLGDELRHPV